MDSVASIYEDSLGGLWLGLGDGGVDLFENGRFLHAKKQGGDDGGRRGAARALVEDLEGRLWVGFESGGIGLLDPASLSFSLPQRSEASGISVLFRDRSGILWAGLAEGGIRAYNIRTAPFFKRIASPGGHLPFPTAALLEDADGHVLAALAMGRHHGR